VAAEANSGPVIKGSEFARPQVAKGSKTAAKLAAKQNAAIAKSEKEGSDAEMDNDDGDMEEEGEEDYNDDYDSAEDGVDEAVVPESEWFNDMPVADRPLFIPLSENKIAEDDADGGVKIKGEKGAASKVKAEDGAAATAASSSGNRLLFLQLPDVLPTTVTKKGGGGAAVGAAVVEDQGAGGEPDLLTDVTFVNKMKQLGDGMIGSLRRRKSGAMELQLGEHTLLLNAGTPVNFLQELVAMSDRENPQQLVNLGTVAEKYVASPSLSLLLEGTHDANRG
jgi:hypothetical protein